MKVNKQTVKKWAKEIASTALIVFVIANAISFFKAPDIKDKNLPNLSTMLINQKVFSTKESKGKPLLIHFWATWCPTCKLEAGNIQTLSESYEVITIAVKSGENGDISSYLNEHNFDFKVINDKQGILAQRFKVPAFPTTFIYNKEGKLSFTEVGYTSTFSLYLRMWFANQ